ncbi:hypothetical protein AJ79_07230 [Helicocarpus griseus UAMH5409]|uniref:Rhodopsin domain-containing protein n=1 Tax=Helicocarpus griseus UAMH5409 TaxID=1447875 RepID=A0A2B7X5H5_9EURO|nr:hypothetical protein AJ79_07230 [Helicocarpus griseus UAMH5409]
MDQNPDTLQPWTKATTAAVTVLAFVSVCLRLLARYEKKQSLWWDDWLMALSMLWNFAVVGLIYEMIEAGMGLHATTIPAENVVRIAKLLVGAEILYVFNLVWTKLSLLMLFYRIFRVSYFKRWAYIIGAFIIAWVICITFLFIFICVPVEKVWYPQLPGRCINQVGTWIANAISTIVTDLAILLLPIASLWRLQLRVMDKIALSFIFGLGFFVIFASAYRLKVLFSYTSLDSSYTLAPTVGWTAIEMSVGIVSANLPTMRPAFHFFARKMGLENAMPSFLRSQTRKDGNTSHKGTGGYSNYNGTSNSVQGFQDHVRKTSHSDFHRLPDEFATGSDDNIPLDVRLRPDHGHAYAVRGEKGGDALSDDKVPLHSIRVQKDFKQEVH